VSNEETILGLLPPPDDVATVIRSDDPGAALNIPDGTIAEDCEILFVSPVEGGDDLGSFKGPQGLIDGWREWLEPWETYTFILEETIPAGDKVVTMARMCGTTRHGGVEVDQQGAAVWTFSDGRVTAIRFYLEREAALREAGIEPGLGRVE
jgi:hypothetical protein